MSYSTNCCSPKGNCLGATGGLERGLVCEIGTKIHKSTGVCLCRNSGLKRRLQSTRMGRGAENSSTGFHENTHQKPKYQILYQSFHEALCRGSLLWPLEIPEKSSGSLDGANLRDPQISALTFEGQRLPGRNKSRATDHQQKKHPKRFPLTFSDVCLLHCVLRRSALPRASSPTSELSHERASRRRCAPTNFPLGKTCEKWRSSLPRTDHGRPPCPAHHVLRNGWLVDWSSVLCLRLLERIVGIEDGPRFL